MSYVVTGATGHLGRLVVESLLNRGVPAERIIATGRRTEKINDLATAGVQVRPVDLNDPSSARAGFDGASRLLLVSGPELGIRVEQHKNAIKAAEEAGVELIAYTSIAHAETTTMRLADDHKSTEAILHESGVPHVLLRNGWYLENYTAHLSDYLKHGVVLGSAGAGRVSAAARADYAEAAAVVLAGAGEAGKVYELGGDTPFSMAELAAEIAAHSGQPMRYEDLPVAEYAKVLAGAGIPEPVAEVLADADHGVARGELLVDNGELRRLINRPTTPMPDAVAAALA